MQLAYCTPSKSALETKETLQNSDREAEEIGKEVYQTKKYLALRSYLLLFSFIEKCLLIYQSVLGSEIYFVTGTIKVVQAFILKSDFHIANRKPRDGAHLLVLFKNYKNDLSESKFCFRFSARSSLITMYTQNVQSFEDLS